MLVRMRAPGDIATSTGSAAVTRRWAFATVGLAAGFSGLAVIGTILTGLPLMVLEAVLVLVPVSAAVIVVRRNPPQVVREIGRIVRIGIVAGLAATLIYDVTRTVLSWFDPSPYDPFEAIRRFGLGMLPATAPVELVMAVGLGIHAVNGTSFGVIYAIFAGRHVRTLGAALAAGVLWGLSLEFVQSVLYPGWLRITTVLDEFLLISGLGHVAYGLSLGVGVRWLLGRSVAQGGAT